MNRVNGAKSCGEIQKKYDFPRGSVGKESACNAGVEGLISVGKIPWRRAWQHILVSLP